MSSRRKTTDRSLLDGGRGRGGGGSLAAAAGVLAGLGLAGCEVDSFMDPSVVGRWENTPVIMPILERIDVIESDTGEFVEVTEVRAEDLVPVIEDYRVSAGDLVRVIVYDLEAQGQATTLEAVVDSTGHLNLPQLGRVFVEDLATPEIEQAVGQRLIDLDLLDAPAVTVSLLGRRQESFSVFGFVPRPSRFQIPYPDYRLLEALTDAGGVSPVVPHVFVIRQAPLTDEVEFGVRRTLPTTVPRPAGGGPDPDGGEELLRIIDDLVAPEDDGGPAVFGPAPGAWATPAMQDGPANRPMLDLDDDGGDRAAGEPPVLDLVDDEPAPAGSPRGPVGAVELTQGPSRWLFLNGSWVQVIRRTAASDDAGPPAGEDPLDDAPVASDLVAQRVIKVPTGPLLQGVASYNIVIRPQDVISVPGPEQGVVYLGGPGIARPGTFPLPTTGPFTIQRAVFAAGGLSPIAIPERVDLTRMIGADKQATLRLNVRDIFDGRQPDIVLKPNDMLNFGTNFWATPLAIIRGGFRASYGFGFLLDRNFGNDVFGAPPSNVGGG